MIPRDILDVVRLLDCLEEAQGLADGLASRSPEYRTLAAGISYWEKVAELALDLEQERLDIEIEEERMTP